MSVSYIIKWYTVGNQMIENLMNKSEKVYSKYADYWAAKALKSLKSQTKNSGFNTFSIISLAI